MSERSPANQAWYKFLHGSLRVAAATLYSVRVDGHEHVPRVGGALVLSNHQSHLDPMLVGMACDRRLNYVARQTLFRFAPLRWLIKSLDAIPLDRDGLGLNGLKETLRRLRRGEMVLLFPEGTRTPDGQIKRFRPGFSALVQRTKVPIAPVAIAGAFEAWPRQRSFPLLSTIQIQFGPVLSGEEGALLEDRELVAEIERRIRACHEMAKAKLARRLQPPLTGGMHAISDSDETGVASVA